MGNCIEYNHKYDEKKCNCGNTYCYNCCGSTNVDQGGKYEVDFMTCPKCGRDWYKIENK